MSTIQPVKTLKAANYSFDHVQNAWFCGKKPVDEEEVLIHLIRFAKSQNIQNAGEYAAAALEKARAAPELTTRAFMKTRMVRNRNRRTAGKYLFLNWTRAVGIEITGRLEDFMARNSLLVNRFYNEIAAGYECCKKQARIAGRVMRSVFIGWELRDEDVDVYTTKPQTAPQNHDTKGNNEGLRRYEQFMRQLFTADP